MIRTIGAVVAGYLTMAVLVFLSFTLAYVVMGAEHAFQAGSYEVSGLWAATSIGLGVLAAIAGGFVCALISRDRTGPRALAVVVLILGLVLAIPAITGGGETAELVRQGDVGNFEAMQSAKQPLWVTLLNPLIGVVGVLIGAALYGRGAAGPPSGS